MMKVLKTILAVVVLILFTFFSQITFAQTLPAVNQEIVNATNQYPNGQFVGECRPFVGQILRDASIGNSSVGVGAGYRKAYLKYAFEVNSADVIPGDIMQTSNDEFTNQNDFKFYKGYHSAVVLENKGNDIYSVVHSNWDYDGKVSRMTRDFFAWARSQSQKFGYTLTVHFYRFSKPGFFYNGWSSPISTAILGCYFSHGANTIIGKPFDNGSGAYVHYWPNNSDFNKVAIQDFKSTDGRIWHIIYIVNAF